VNGRDTATRRAAAAAGRRGGRGRFRGDVQDRDASR
jgi:hypothetical protein